MRPHVLILSALFGSCFVNTTSAEMVTDLEPPPAESAAADAGRGVDPTPSPKRVDAIPEPTSLALLGIVGGTGLAVRAVRRRSRRTVGDDIR